MKKFIVIAGLLLLPACTNPQGCANEPYYRHADTETDVKIPGASGDSPFSDVHLGAGCDQKSFILHKTIPLDK